MRTLHAADAFCALSLGILDRKLHVIQARSFQPCQQGSIQQHARGDEIGIKPRMVRGGGDIHNVAPRGGLAARKMRLQTAKFSSLRENIGPFGGSEFTRSACQLKRVGTIGATQRTAMREFRQDGQRRIHA